MDSRPVLLDVDKLRVEFKVKAKEPLVAVRDVSFQIYEGETFGLVGESGSGKTTIGRTIIRIHEATSGEVRYRGQRISGAISRELDRKVTQSIQMIFQDPMASLNERAKIDYIVSEGLYNTGQFANEEERSAKVTAVLEEVGLLPEFASRFPHEFSGGQRQRIGVARALIVRPEFIIADEPISALDVSIRAQVLNLLSRLQKEFGLTYLFIAHDLSVVRFITDRVAVINLGRIVELAETEELFENPLHPYTESLLSAIPLPDPHREKQKVVKVYDPSIHDYSSGEPRLAPRLAEITPGHFVLGNDAEIAGYHEVAAVRAGERKTGQNSQSARKNDEPTPNA
ncbi:MAG: ATP-binding cassette domain-containing protein [Spirochaetaceae bacterium]|nr:MAG: ATP-binding cassette domain-containing protein [Spirochaetaceae bacterium]